MDKFKKVLFGFFVLAMVNLYSIDCFAMENNDMADKESKISDDVDKENKNNILNMEKINKYVAELKEKLNNKEEVISYFGAEFIRKILLQKLKENLVKKYSDIISKIIPNEYFISNENNKVELKIFERRINSENFVKFRNIFEFVLPLKFNEEFDLKIVINNLNNLDNNKIFKSAIKETINQFNLIEEGEFKELKDKVLSENFYYSEQLYGLIRDDEKYNEIIDQLGKIRKNISCSYLKNLDNFIYDIKFSVPDVSFKDKSKIILENTFKNGIKDNAVDLYEDKKQENTDKNKIIENIKNDKKELKEKDKDKSCVITSLPYENKYIFRQYLNDSRKNLNFNQTIFDFIKQSNNQYGVENIKEKTKELEDSEKVGVGLKTYNPSYMLDKNKFQFIGKEKFLLTYIFLSNIFKPGFDSIKLYKIFDRGYFFKKYKSINVDSYSTDESRSEKDIGIDRFYDLFIIKDFNNNLKYPEKIKFDKEIFDCIGEYKDQFLKLKEKLLDLEEEKINIGEKIRQLTDNIICLHKISKTILNEKFCKEIKEKIRVNIGKQIIEQLKVILDGYFQETCVTREDYLYKKNIMLNKPNSSIFKLLKNKNVDEYLNSKDGNKKLKIILKDAMLELRKIELNFLNKVMEAFKNSWVSLTKKQFNDLFSLFDDLEIDLSTNKEFQKYVRNFKKHFLKEKFKIIYASDIKEYPAKIFYERINSICDFEINLEDFKNYVKDAQIKFDFYKYNPNNKDDSNCGIEPYKLESRSLNVRYKQSDYIAHTLYQKEMLNELEKNLDKIKDLKCIVNSGIFENNTASISNRGKKNDMSYISLLVDPENNPYKLEDNKIIKDLEEFYKNISSKVIDNKLKKIDEKEYKKLTSGYGSGLKCVFSGVALYYNCFDDFKLNLDILNRPEFKNEKSYGFWCNDNEDFYAFYYPLNYLYFIMFSEILKDKLKDYVDDVQIRFKNLYNLNYLLCDKVEVFLKYKKDFEGENELKDEVKKIVNEMFPLKDVEKFNEELEYNEELDELKNKAFKYLKNKDEIKLEKKGRMIDYAKEYFCDNDEVNQEIKKYFDFESKSMPNFLAKKLETEFAGIINPILFGDKYEIENKKTKSSFLEYVENRNKKEECANKCLKQKIESYVKDYEKNSRAKKAIYLALCEMKDDIFRRFTKWKNNSYKHITEEKLMEDFEEEIMGIIKKYYNIPEDEKKYKEKIEKLRRIINSAMALCLYEHYKRLNFECDENDKENREQLDDINWGKFDYENNRALEDRIAIEEKSKKFFKRLIEEEFLDKNKKNLDISKNEAFEEFLDMKQNEKKLKELKENALKYVEDKDKKILDDREQLKKRVQDAIKNFEKKDIFEEGLEDFNVSFHDIEELK